MNAQTGTALALPEPAALATIFRTEGQIDPLLEKIAAEARAHVADTSTKRGREAIASLAYKVARSKTALDDAGKALNEDARKQIGVVDAARRVARDFLDKLRDEVRKPLDDWEAAEEKRLADLKDRLARLQAAESRPLATSAEARALLEKLEAAVIDESWQEYREIAERARAGALAAVRSSLASIEAREAQEAELERLRIQNARLEAEAAERRRIEEEAAEAERQRLAAEEEARQQAARLAREEEERAAAKLRAVASLREYIAEVRSGFIGGCAQPYGILIHELERRVPAEIVGLGDEAEPLSEVCREAADYLRDQMEKQEAARQEQVEREKAEAAEAARREAKERAAREKAKAEERHRLELAEAREREERAAQAERDRIAAEREAEEAAAAKRRADAAHRERISAAIVEAIFALTGRREDATEIAEALMAGEIPHVEVKL